MRASMIVMLLLAAGCDEARPADAGTAPEAGTDAGMDAGPSAPRCAEGLDAGEGARGITRGCGQELVTSGFGLRYAAGGQPLARLGAHVRLEAPEICDPGTRFSSLTLVTDVDPRAEAAIARATYHVVGEGDRPPDAGAGPAPLRIERGRVVLDLSAETPEVTVPALFDLAPVALDDGSAIAVVLDGFEIDTDITQDPAFPPGYDPGDGFALSALGASVGAVTVDGSDLRFEVTGRLAFGTSGDSLRDAAASVARARLLVRYAVVALEVAPTLGTVAYEGTCRPDAAELVIDGPAGARAAPAFTSFLLTLRPDEPEGVLVQELAVLIDAFRHDPASGRATMRVEGFVAGPDDIEIPQRFEAEVALLSWTGGDAVEALRYARRVSSGLVETPLPIAP